MALSNPFNLGKGKGQAGRHFSSEAPARRGNGGGPLRHPDAGQAVKVPGTLVISSIENCRDLGGYPTPEGYTQPHRFLRSGNTAGITPEDAQLLRSWGLARVLDLRGPVEAHDIPDAFERVRGVRYKEVPLHDKNLHDPRLVPQSSDDSMNDFLTNGYLKMLGNKPAIRKIFRFFSHAKAGECVLYHCAAGMDRTGVTSMLLLGLAGVDRAHIMADYGYSFGTHPVVNTLVFGSDTDPATAGSEKHAQAVPRASHVGGASIAAAYSSSAAKTDWPDRGTVEALNTLCQLMGNVYDRVLDAYGSVEQYLLGCDCKPRELERVKQHLLEP